LAATTYTIIGVMNKMFTVLVNVVIWDNHASPIGIASLAACLAGGSLYQQAPLRKDVSLETRTLLSALPEDSEPSGATVSCNSRLSFTSGATTSSRCGGNTPRTEEAGQV
jgi:GDP-mannose transporter